MRKLIWQMMTSLDGYMAGPDRELDWHVTDDGFQQYVLDMFENVDTIVFGRVTYQMMAAYWPTASEPEAPFMNALPKIVFSRTLETVDWNNSRLATGDVTEEITTLKRLPGKDIAVFGSSDLASTLVKLGLVDEFRFFVNPVVLGSGLPLFKDADRMKLELLSSRAFHSGNVLLTYRSLPG